MWIIHRKMYALTKVPHMKMCDIRDTLLQYCIAINNKIPFSCCDIY